MWRLYVDVPSNSHALPSKCKVATKLDEVLLDHIEGKKVIHYWTQHFVLPANLLDQIDWSALSLARSKTNFHFRKWATKWAAEKLPTGMEMQDRETWATACCPRKC
eukprot:3714769-Ditylum_brightwellii.AAC.1